MMLSSHHFQPAPIKDLVVRDRLNNLRQHILEKQVITISAPAGYGKTVWISSQIGTPNWPETLWLSLDRQDSEPSVFLCHLIRSIDKDNQSTAAWRTLNSLQNFGNEWTIAAAAFLESLPRNGRFMLVLDDAHFIYDNQTTISVLEYILDRLPGHVQFMLIARSLPPFRFYRQVIKSQLLQINSQDLVFSEEEAKSLFTNMALKLSDSDAAALYALTEGWAVGLRLLGIYLQMPGSSVTDALQNLHRENSSFYLFMMNELLTSIPKSAKEFLLCASLLPFLEPGLCNTSLMLTSSGSMLDMLREYGLLFPYDGDNRVWRIHSLVKSWLQDIAIKQLDSQTVRQIHERASLYFEQNANIGRAIEQCICAQNWNKTADLIHDNGDTYLTQGFALDSLYKWITQLPKELVDNDCGLLYYKGLCILYVDDNEAFQILSKSVEIAETNGDLKCETKAILAMLIAAIASGDLHKCALAGRYFQNNPQLMENPSSRSEAMVVALQFAMANDNLQEGIALSRKALLLDLPSELNMWVRYTTSYLYLRVGRLDEARKMIEEILPTPYVQENERRLIIGYGILLDISFLMGDFTVFDSAGQTCLALGQKYGMLGILGRVHCLKAHCHYREGRYQEALQALYLAHKCYSSAGVVHFKNQVEIDILYLRIAEGENAAVLFEQMLELKTQFENTPYGIGIDHVINASVGIAALEAGKLEAAAELLEKTALRWRDIGAVQELAGVNLCLAYARLLQGDDEKCDSLLNEALGALEAGHWVNCWAWHHVAVYTMCERAIQKDIHPLWAAHLLKRWFPAESHRDFSSLLRSQSEPLRTFAARHFEENHQTTGQTVLSVFYLDGFDVFVNGTQIHASGWKTKKAENLFKYLVADRRLSSKDLLIQTLWPDSSMETGDGKLRMTLSYVRKALANAGLKSDIVTVHKGMVRLNPEFEIHCDYEDYLSKVRKGLSYASVRHPLAVYALEQALQVYSGEFLPEDLYEDLMMDLRRSLHNLYLEGLLELARLQSERGKMQAAWHTCLKYLSNEPVDENVIRLAMRILLRLNKKTKAIGLYRDLKTMLSRDYGTVPEKETDALYREIQGVRDESL